MKVSQSYRVALIASMLPILSSGLNMRGFAQANSPQGAKNKDGKPADEAKLKTCFPCHQPFQAGDFVFTRYAP